MFKYLIINYLGLDINVYFEFLLVYTPSALASQLAAGWAEVWFDKKGITLSNTICKPYTLYMDNGPNVGGNSSGQR